LVDGAGERWTTKTADDKDVDGDGYLEPTWDVSNTTLRTDYTNVAEMRDDEYMRSYQNINGSRTFTIRLEEKTEGTNYWISTGSAQITPMDFWKLH